MGDVRFSRKVEAAVHVDAVELARVAFDSIGPIRRLLAAKPSDASRAVVFSSGPEPFRFEFSFEFAADDAAGR
jgi:hypothetical protein